MNLCEILKGHEGETFYSPFVGEIKLEEIPSEGIVFSVDSDGIVILPDDGLDFDGRMSIFPSKDQRDWEVWVESQKPKTWSDLLKSGNAQSYQVDTHKPDDNTPIVKSAKALLKIHQLIEVGYGGNVTNEEWKDNTKIKFNVNVYNDKSGANFIIYETTCIHHIAFHNKKQAEEFLRYPENIQLLKDYYMIYDSL